MLQAIPLTATLSVDVYLIIKSVEIKRFLEIDNRLVERLAAKARELDILKTPIELDMLAVHNLSTGITNHIWSQKIES